MVCRINLLLLFFGSCLFQVTLKMVATWLNGSTFDRMNYFDEIKLKENFGSKKPEVPFKHLEGLVF